MSLHIRPAVREDAALILRFITDLAIYEKAKQEVKTDVAGIENSLICELDGEPIGYAVYFFNYSTWLGKHGLYLEDLYVTPQQRGVGAGKALLRHLAKLAVARGCGRFEWSVLDWNQPAIDFYESIGARPQNEWIGYRLAGDALSEFAAG